MAQIRPLALELPYAADAALKWKKKKKRELFGKQLIVSPGHLGVERRGYNNA